MELKNRGNWILSTVKCFVMLGVVTVKIGGMVNFPHSLDAVCLGDHSFFNSGDTVAL